MNWKCSLGFHSWNHDWRYGSGCDLCDRCGLTRELTHKWTKTGDSCQMSCSMCDATQIEHTWKGCKCAKCEETRKVDNGHNWRSTGNGCHAKCSNCDATQVHHTWKGCKCKNCEETRDEGHFWKGCKCSQCEKVRDDRHAWRGCKCSTCGKERDKGHSFTGCECSKCGATRHKWQGPIIKHKGATCSVCSDSSGDCGHSNAHWGGGTCNKCGVLWCANCLDPQGQQRRQGMNQLFSNSNAFVLDGGGPWNSQGKAYCPLCKSWTVRD